MINDPEIGELLSIISQKKIKPYFQTIVDVNTNIVGIEILARWVDTTNVVQLPSDFIGRFEKNGLLVDLTCSLIEQVIGVFSSIYIERIPDKFYVCINVTEDLLSSLVFKSYVFKLSLLCDVILEFSEKNKIISNDIVRKNILDFRTFNVKFAIDDFGVDNSSFHLLYEFDFDILKLDKYFISLLYDNSFCNDKEKKRLIIKNILELCSILEMKLVVEGIESKDQEVFLKSIGVKYFQGYLYSRPVSIDNLYI